MLTLRAKISCGGLRGEGALGVQVADAASASDKGGGGGCGLPLFVTSVSRRSKGSSKQPGSAALHLLNCLFQSPPSHILQERKLAASVAAAVRGPFSSLLQPLIVFPRSDASDFTAAEAVTFARKRVFAPSWLFPMCQPCSELKRTRYGCTINMDFSSFLSYKQHLHGGQQQQHSCRSGFFFLYLAASLNFSFVLST